MQLLTENS